MLLVVPACIWSAWLSTLGRPAGPLLAIGPTSYSTYMFIQYVLGPEYERYSLTVLLHLALVALSGGLAFWAWALSAGRPVPARSARTRRLHGWLLVGFAAFVLLRYVGVLTGAVAGAALEAEFAADVTFFWSILLLDLGVVVPVTLVVGVALLRGSATAARAVYGVVGWFALAPPSVAPPSVAMMALVMLVRDDANASVGSVALLGAASVVFGAVAVAVFRPLWRPTGQAPTEPGSE